MDFSKAILVDENKGGIENIQIKKVAFITDSKTREKSGLYLPTVCQYCDSCKDVRVFYDYGNLNKDNLGVMQCLDCGYIWNYTISKTENIDTARIPLYPLTAKDCVSRISFPLDFF